MQRLKKHISAKDLQNWIILITGIVFCISGIVLIVSQTKAEGSIDIRMVIFSGKITSPNAGLFICFFGMVLIALSKISPRTSRK